MSLNTHSAGPWTSGTKDGVTTVYDANGTAVAAIFAQQEENNVPVITDSPELLSALEELLNYFGEYEKDYGERIPEIRAGWAIVEKVKGYDSNFDDGFEDDKMDYGDWVEAYRPVQNWIEDNASMDGTMFETFGPEHNYVMSQKEQKPKQIWTLLEGDEGQTFVSSGYHHANRLGYFITEVAFEGEHLEVPVGEPDPDENSDNDA